MSNADLFDGHTRRTQRILLQKPSLQPATLRAPKVDIDVSTAIVKSSSLVGGAPRQDASTVSHPNAPDPRRGLLSVNRARRPEWLVRIHYLLVLAMVSVAYLTVLYILIPENTLLFFPFIYDDYIALSSTLPHDFIFRTRPIHHLLEELFATRGMSLYYVALTIFSILNVWLVLLFAFRICQRSVPLLWSFCYSVVVFSAPTYIWAGKYNVLTNHGSMLFGILAMFALLVGFEQRSILKSLLSVPFLALSIFAKEDYFVPVLCMGFYVLIIGGRATWKRNGLVLAGLVGVFIAFIVHTIFIVPFSHVMFDVNLDHPYAQVLSLPSMMETIRTYFVFYSLPTSFLLAAFVLSVGYALFIGRKQHDYLLLAVIGGLLVPYSILPNHVTEYNAINWIPWMAVFALVQMPVRFALQKIWVGPYRLTGTIVIAIVLGAIAASTVILTQQEREREVRSFVRQSTINRNILDSLLAYRNQLEGLEDVGIVGVEEWSPWLKTEAEFLSDRGFKNRWLLFVRKNDFYNEQLAVDPYQQPNPEIFPTRSVTFLRLIDLERYPDLPILEFDRNGNAFGLGMSAHDYFRTCISISLNETEDLCQKRPKFKKRVAILGTPDGS